MDNLTTCKFIEYCKTKIDATFPHNVAAQDLILSVVYSCAHFSKVDSYDSTSLSRVTVSEDWDKLIAAAQTSSADAKNVYIDSIAPSNNTALIFCSSNSMHYRAAAERNANTISNSTQSDTVLIDPGRYHEIIKNLYTCPELNEAIDQCAAGTTSLYMELAKSFYSSHIERRPKINTKDVFSYIRDTVKAFIFSTRIFDCGKTKLLVTLNPFSRIESGALAALRASQRLSRKPRSWYIPHGLAQRSMYLFTFDIISPLTFDLSWLNFRGVPILLPWFESSEGKLTKTKPNKNLNILFFSQLDGARLHNVPEIVDITERAINLLLASSLVQKVKLRLRNYEEKKLLRFISWENDKLEYSSAEDTPLHEDLAGFDCLTSLSSTALLYSQETLLPSIQFTSETIFETWPYKLALDKRIIQIENNREDVRNLDIALRDVLTNGNSLKMFYRNRGLNLADQPDSVKQIFA